MQVERSNCSFLVLLFLVFLKNLPTELFSLFVRRIRAPENFFQGVFMNIIDIDFIQSGINYHFKNPVLLHQAFTRKSYSAEHPEAQDNEVLEFYGDAVLDFFVTKMMYERFSKIVNNEFVSQKNEGELTKLKSILVSKDSLAQCVYNFGFSQFLYLGKSDEQNNVQNSKSANEDLFEAIIGAVAADCNWDYEKLERVCKTMLQMETVNNYLTLLVKEKSHALGHGEPLYHPMWWQVNDVNELQPHNFYINGYLGIQEVCTSKNPKTGKHEYWIDIGGNKFKGTGDGTFQAKLDADRQAYHFLCQEEIRRQFEKIDYDNSVSALHELFQKKIIMEVRYEFSEYHDENGNPVWNCKALLEGYGSFSADDISKKQAKQDTASRLLHFITDTEIEKSDTWENPILYTGQCRWWTDEQKAEMKALFDSMEHGGEK